MIEIKRCLCFDQQFADLKDIADKTGSKTVHELQNHVEFGNELPALPPIRAAHAGIRRKLCSTKSSLRMVEGFRFSVRSFGPTDNCQP